VAGVRARLGNVHQQLRDPDKNESRAAHLGREVNEMSDQVFAGRLLADELRRLVESPPRTFKWMIVEAVDEILFDSFRSDVDVGRFETGRMFDEFCELRWRRDGPRFHTLLIGNLSKTPALLSAHRVLAVSEFEPVSCGYFLWGEWRGRSTQWVEASIPHIFSYPSPPDIASRWRRKITAIEYINRTTVEMEFYRFTGVEWQSVTEVADESL
jgi:hypothetical protein